MGGHGEDGAQGRLVARRTSGPVIHLDTSFLIRALLEGSGEDRRLRAWLGEGTAVGASAIVWAEFLCGPVHANHIELAITVVAERVSFTEEDAAMTASLFNGTGRRRGSLADCMIAASAIRCSAALATANANDFARFKSSGLTLIDA